MKEYNYATRYKECSPLETIHRIRCILYDLGILVKEDWMQGARGYYSLNLSVTGTGLSVNGKGSSQEYALASAYGELMERLQNAVVLRLYNAMRKEALEYGGFYFAPDEKHVGIEEILRCSGKWLEAFTFQSESEKEKKAVLENWKTADLYGGSSDFIALPYRNYTDNSIQYVPTVMLMNMYGTNGMCAGNTAEEALVQGISEVIERYVNIRIVREGVVPPTVPESHIAEHFPHISRMMRELEGRGPFKVIVKDCSLGQGFPCLGIFFLNTMNKSYFIKFGVHPAFEIALERCLTELLQGRSLDEPNWMMEFMYQGKSGRCKLKNEYGILRDGAGYYPAIIFSDESSYGFSEFQYHGSCDNKEMLSYLVELIRGKGYKILIRDVSFLGFPSFHVIVPFFSETVEPDMQTIHLEAGAKRAFSILMRLEEASDDELKQVIDFMHAFGYNPSHSFVNALRLPIKANFPWTGVTWDLFACLAYYRTGEWEKAYDTLKSFLRVSASHTRGRDVVYYRCMRDYLGARLDGIEDECRIAGILTKVYPEDMVRRVLSDMRNPSGVFKPYGRLHCFECGKCGYTAYCTYKETEKIYIKLKDRYMKNVIDQDRIADNLFCPQ